MTLDLLPTDDDPTRRADGTPDYADPRFCPTLYAADPATAT